MSSRNLHNESILSQTTEVAQHVADPSTNADQSTDVRSMLEAVPWSRHVSPRVVSSFQLADNHEWNTRDLLQGSFRDHGAQGTREQPTCEKWLHVLVWFGWLPSKSSRVLRDVPFLVLCARHIPFLIMLSLEIFIVVSLPAENVSTSTFKLVHWLDSSIRHSCVVLAHVGIYLVGGRRLFDVLKDLESPRLHCKVILILVLIASGVDICILGTRLGLFQMRAQPEGTEARLVALNWSTVIRGFRRLFIMFERWTCAVAMIVMMSIPRKLCQALVQAVQAVEQVQVDEVERLYGGFWMHMRLARGWYNAVMSPLFLIAIGRIPIAIYVFQCTRTWENYYTILSFYFYCVIAIVDTVTMMVWLQPAIQIRSNHGVVYRATLDFGFQEVQNGAALTTLMSSLHHMMGLKMLGFIVKWKLVAQTASVITVLLYVVRIVDGYSSGAATVEPSTRWIHNCTGNNSLFSTWNSKCSDHETLWSSLRDSNGTKQRFDGKESGLCNGLSLPPGTLSCENRQRAWKSKHVLLLPHGAATGNLVVFLPGTGVGPSAYASLLRAAQDVGHHVLGLSYYSNPLPVVGTNAWCNDRTIISAPVHACNRELHELMLFGKSPRDLKGASKDLWSIGESHSLITLCVDALRSVSWGSQFKIGNEVENEVDWSKVIISGHGQGASYAAYLSFKLHVRAVLFGGPQDCEICGEKWVPRMSRQKVPRRALIHRREECGTSLISDNLKRMGLNDSLLEWKGEKRLELDDVSVVISAAEPSYHPSCRSSAQMYYESIAQSQCASKDISTLWRSMFSFESDVAVT